MKREDKTAVIEELKEKFSNNQNYYFTNAGGMTVAEVNDFRRLCMAEKPEKQAEMIFYQTLEKRPAHGECK